MGLCIAFALSACSGPEKKDDALPVTKQTKEKSDPMKDVLKKAPYANPRWQSPPPGMQDGKQKD
jgi:hypothetical protein